MGMLRLALGISAVGWSSLALDEWLRSRRRANSAAGEFRMPRSTQASEATRRAA